MSKDLTPLEALEKLTNYKCSRLSEKVECKEIIEKALKDIDFLKTLNENQKHNIIMLIEENREMKKSLKALGIIKKYVAIDELINDEEFTMYSIRDKQYVSSRSCLIMTKEEFDFLKEILK